MNHNIVSISKSESKIDYPLNPPFHPPQCYPEYPFNQNETDSSNEVYALVRDLLYQLNLDRRNFGTKKWNPLQEIVFPGAKVLIKPNLVLDFNAAGGNLFSVVTHGSVIRAILDYIFIALQGSGEIIIADAPQMNADFEKTINQNGLADVVRYYREKIRNSNIHINLIDLRMERTIYKFGVIWERLKLTGDPKGYITIDLGESSEFSGTNCSNVYGADYNRLETKSAHSGKSHRYCISRSVLDADVIVNVPKMKVHKKAGVTLNLKNIVGISGNKNYIIHYKVGSPEENGDESPHADVSHKIDRVIRDVFMGKLWPLGKYVYAIWMIAAQKLGLFPEHEIWKGDWYRNDTVWRGALDLNKILFYADKNGRMTPNKVRRFFSIIDGIIAGEKEGPLSPTAKYCGVLVGGFNPVYVDLCTARLMDFDYRKIPIIDRALNMTTYPLSQGKIDDISVNTNIHDWSNILNSQKKFLEFEPSSGWRNHIEF